MNGIIGEVDLTVEQAADGRHSPVLENIGLPETHDAILCGEVLFEDEDGAAVSLADASSITLETSAFDGTLTDATIDFGVPIVPGSVTIITDDTTPKAITDNGDGTLGSDTDAGDGNADYVSGVIAMSFDAAPANGKIATVAAVPVSGFVGVCNEARDAEDENALVVEHGSLVRGIAKINGEAINTAQQKMLKTLGIF